VTHAERVAARDERRGADLGRAGRVQRDERVAALVVGRDALFFVAND